MYREILPDKKMSNFLEAIWFSKSDAGQSNILPDNYSDIIIDLNKSNKVKFVGNMTKNMTHFATDNELLLGLRFKPAYSSTFIKGSLAELTDQVIDLSTIVNHSFHEVSEIYQESGQIPMNLIYNKIIRICGDISIDPHIKQSVDIIENSFGEIKIKTLSETLGISQRTLEKKFKYFMGKSPKRFAQIERLNAIINNKASFSTLNYYDQSHMIKEFEMLTGTTFSKLSL